MWLLNAETRKLENFIDSTAIVGRYAILSHTWEDEEVTFDEIDKPEARSKKGYRKIDLTCKQALRDGLQYAWVDTCCIDKRSSADLSEAINSMYRWYYDAQVCYAFLSDIFLELHKDILELALAHGPTLNSSSNKMPKQVPVTAMCHNSAQSVVTKLARSSQSDTVSGQSPKKPFLQDYIEHELSTKPQTLHEGNEHRAYASKSTASNGSSEVKPNDSSPLAEDHNDGTENDTQSPRRLSHAFLGDTKHNSSSTEVGLQKDNAVPNGIDNQSEGVFRWPFLDSSPADSKTFASLILRRGSVRPEHRKAADDFLDVPSYKTVDSPVEHHGKPVDNPVENQSKTALPPLAATTEDTAETRMGPSRWFSRGWTLQELIAPDRVVFFDSKWLLIGTKKDHVEDLAFVTGVDPAVLLDRRLLSRASVGKRMSWAAMCKTTREEDMAYCLLGIFDVNMPLLYGEGKKAFIRLQEEIIRSSDSVDHSILAWSKSDGGLLAPSPDKFQSKRKPFTWRLPQRQTFELSNNGLRATLFVRARGTEHNRHHEGGSRDSGSAANLTAVLNCCDESSRSTHLALVLHKRPRVETISRNVYVNTASENDAHEEEVYDRSASLTTVESHELTLFSKKTLTIARTPWKWPTWQHCIRIISTSQVTIDYTHKPYTSQGCKFDRGSGILSLPVHGEDLLLMFSAVNDTDGSVTLDDDTCLMSLTPNETQIPELRCTNLNWYNYERQPLQRGIERILRKDRRKIFKVLADIIAYEGAFLWNVEVTASYVHELEAEPVARVYHELSADAQRTREDGTTLTRLARRFGMSRDRSSSF